MKGNVYARYPGSVQLFFRSYKKNLLLADIDASNCNFQYYFLQVA
jgi:hypothetical protein